MTNQVQNIKNIYSDFVSKLGLLRAKQFDFLRSLIKKREVKKLEEIQQEIKKYE
jgi:hypothetical protein